MNLKVGDKIKIINSGKIYSTYSDWVKSNVKSKKLQNLFDVGTYYLDGYENDIFTVKANALHHLGSYLMLYYIQNDRTKRCYIISEDGIEIIRKKFFKSLPNNFTGTLEVKNGYILEKEILDDTEKRYLKTVIRPFKDKIKCIKKLMSLNKNKEYISIRMEGEAPVDLPYFERNTMYEGMKADKEYTLKELGLDE